MNEWEFQYPTCLKKATKMNNKISIRFKTTEIKLFKAKFIHLWSSRIIFQTFKISFSRSWTVRLFPGQFYLVNNSFNWLRWVWPVLGQVCTLRIGSLEILFIKIFYDIPKWQAIIVRTYLFESCSTGTIYFCNIAAIVRMHITAIKTSFYYCN